MIVPEVVSKARDDEQAPLNADGGVWACCHFKEFVLRRNSTKTRAARDINFGDYMDRYDACEQCRREYENTNARCDNPFRKFGHRNFRRNVLRLEGKYKDCKRYPVFKNCRYVCAFCLFRARKERHAKKIKTKVLKKKIKTNLRTMGLDQSLVKKAVTQILTKPQVVLEKTHVFLYEEKSGEISKLSQEGDT